MTRQSASGVLSPRGADAAPLRPDLASNFTGLPEFVPGGVVYFVRATAGEVLIKIGQTRHPRERMLALQRDCPCPIELLCMPNGNRALEMRFHARFFADHVRGEWFRATPELLDCIAKIASPEGLAGEELPAKGVMLYGPQATRLRAHD